MSESGPQHVEPGKTGIESQVGQSSTIGNLFADPRLSASVMADANEGSRNKRRPWVWALAWVGGFVAVIAALILVLR